MSFFSTALLLFGLFLALLSPVASQTFTSCDPMKKSCPDDPALGMNYTFDFSSADVAKTWNSTNGVVKHGSNGGEFTINKRKESPTIQSEFYIFFGVLEVHMKAAAGKGIISSIVLQSDDRDEIDWEMIGGNNTHVETNYFGKGNDTSFDRAIYYPVQTPMDLFHNYTVRWTADKIEWFIDTVSVRTLAFHDALGGQNFPQTPMTVRLGIWAGGDPDLGKGTNEWAGGLTDFSKAPFTMLVQNVSVTDYSTGSAYHWSDNSGSWQSIKSLPGNSSFAETLNPTPATPTSAKWNSLTTAAKIGILGGAGAAAAGMIGLITFCCIKQRRAGRREQAEYVARLETERREAEAYQMENKNADSLPSTAPTPSEYSRSNSVAGYTKSGASGFGSGGSYYAPTAPPMPTVPAAYSGNGFRSPSGGGFQTSAAGGFNNSGAHSGNGAGYTANGYFEQSQGYHNNGYSRQGYSRF